MSTLSLLTVAAAIAIGTPPTAQEDIAKPSPAASVRVVAGASLLALPYVASAAVAAMGYPGSADIDSKTAPLWYPLAGPFIALGNYHSASTAPWLVADGVAQVAGLGLLIYGLMAPQAPAVGLAPMVGAGRQGAVLSGRF